MSTVSGTQRDDLSAPISAGRAEAALYVVIEGERPLAGGLRFSLDPTPNQRTPKVEPIDEVRLGRGSERKLRIEGKIATVEIPDPRMSSKHARIVREEGGFLLEDLGSTNGTFLDGRRITSAAIEEATILTLGATVFLLDPTEKVPDGTPNVIEYTDLKSRPPGTGTLVPIVNQGMPRLVRVAMSKLSVLLLGESGAGKEVLARSIHTLSGRSGPFVPINCGALAPTLVESQLFGYVKGAFSGALKDEPGLVRSASGGTLFLDEIGELPPAAQATLLRVLQEREVLPVGGTRAVPVDLRVIAATLKPIDDTPSFRPDLYARVAAFVHRLTPLRERRGDIGVLIADLLPRIAPERAATIKLAPDFGTALASHSYPLNVRELEHLLSVATVTSNAPLLRLEDVGAALKSTKPSQPGKPPPPSGGPSPTTSRGMRPPTDEEMKVRDELVAALQRTQGNVSEVARTMGKTRMQIHRWMKRFGIDVESFRPGT